MAHAPLRRRQAHDDIGHAATTHCRDAERAAFSLVLAVGL
jgi:hypothetical protein